MATYVEFLSDMWKDLPRVTRMAGRGRACSRGPKQVAFAQKISILDSEGNPTREKWMFRPKWAPKRRHLLRK